MSEASEETIFQIENFFTEIENLIKFQSQNRLYIEQKFKLGKKLIDELEKDNRKKHAHFRYKYHTIYAKYSKIVGNVDKAEFQERSAKKYEKFLEKHSSRVHKKESRSTTNASSRSTTNTSRSTTNASSENITTNQSSKNKEENVRKALQEELKNIQGILCDNFIESIKQTFRKFDDLPTIFEDYVNIVANETILHRLADSTISESLINLEESNDNKQSKQSDNQTLRFKEDRKQVISSLNHLKSLASKAAYLNRLAFIFHILNSSSKKEILFSNILFTEEEINKRFKEIALYFHSDKIDRPNTPAWLKKEHKSLGIDVFIFAQNFKESLLNDLNEISKVEGRLAYHEKEANYHWKAAIDYRNAARGRWDKLKLLKRIDIEEIPSDELKSFSINVGIFAYQEYRAACKMADKAKILKKQVELRGFMALCLYISNKFIEAQLYALSAIQLQIRNSQRVTRQELNKAKKIFDKVKNGDDITTEEISKLKTEINLNTNDTLALVRTVDQEISIFEKKSIENSVNNDMTNVSIGLILKADRSLVRYQAPKEEILFARNRALKHRIAGSATMAAAVAVKGTILFKVGIVLVGVGSVGGPAAIVGGIAALGLGIWCGINLWTKGSFILKEPKIRENLNNIMIRALEAYDRGEYQKFIEALSEEFKIGKSLIKLEKYKELVVPDKIISTLLKHGFRSDGVAYLLNLLGEVLGSGKIKVEGRTTKDLKAMAINVFDGVLSKELEVEAKKLDDRIRELRKGGKGRTNYVKNFNKVIDFVSFREYSDIAQEHIDDAQEMPFKSRLEEMRNIARINKAIFYIVEAGEEEMEQAIETIKEIQESINSNYQFVDVAKWRYEVLEDLLWVISGEEPPENPPKPFQASDIPPEESSKLSLTKLTTNN